MRRASRRLRRWTSLAVLLAAGCAVTIGVSGCGTNNGFFAQASHTYPITATVTTGALSHSATVTLIVE
jgi:hypothetical protein